MRCFGWIDCPVNSITESDQCWLRWVIEIFKDVPDPHVFGYELNVPLANNFPSNIVIFPLANEPVKL